MTELGGYFGLELRDLGNGVFHNDAISINSARNALDLLLRSIVRPAKMYVPYFCCHVILEPLKRQNVEYEFYSLSDSLLPELSINNVAGNDLLLYPNYFGVCDSQVEEVLRQFGSQRVIIDNTHAFFNRPQESEVSIYSTRKFFGVPDGGFLYPGNHEVVEKIPRDHSINRCEHLLGRTDHSAKHFYGSFKEIDSQFSQLPLASMSKLTESILCSIDFEWVLRKRRNNYEHLHSKLNVANHHNFLSGQFCYPFCNKLAPELRNFLLQHEIYLPRYWPDIDVGKLSPLENSFFEYTLFLPIDQRYGHKEMEYIGDLIMGYLSKHG